MRDTIIRLKDGRIFSSPIRNQEVDRNDFGNSYIELCANPERFYLRDIESAVTKHTWITCSEIGDVDEIENMKSHYEWERKHGDKKNLCGCCTCSIE